MEVITCADGDLHLTKGLHNVVEMGKEKKEEEEKEKKEGEAGPPVAHDCELLGTNQCLFLKLNFLVFQKDPHKWPGQLGPRAQMSGAQLSTFSERTVRGPICLKPSKMLVNKHYTIRVHEQASEN